MRSLTLLLGAAAAVDAQLFKLPSHVPPLDNLPPLPALTRRGKSEPCADVSDLWTSQKAKQTTAIRVPAELAYNCLQSVPVDVSGDLKQISELKDYLEWHSTLAWLKSGVDGQIKPTDLMGSLDAIASKVKDGKFKSDYEVQFSIRALLDSTGDFHVAYVPDLTFIFEFARMGGGLVSFSEDGVKLPKIYLESDVTSGKPASPIATINGKNASAYLEQYSSGHNYHDADTRYNTIFPNPALRALKAGGTGIFLTHYVYDGASTVFTFANGSSKSIDNVAFIGPSHDFSNVSDGPSFFEEFCTGPLGEGGEDGEEEVQGRAAQAQSPSTAAAIASPRTSATTLASAKPSATALASARSSATALSSARPSNGTAPSTPSSTPGSKPASVRLTDYPQPVFINDDGKMSGYYLNDTDSSDVAVLVIPAFDPAVEGAKPFPAHGGFLQTQKMRRAFFDNAVKQGKKKLVIDLRGNGGGFISNGFDVFKQLFPSIEPYGAARFRASEAFHYYTAIIADLAVNGTDFDDVDSESVIDGDHGVQSTFLWSNIVDNDGKAYKNYDDWWAPKTIKDDAFTGIRRYNFSDNIGGHTVKADLTGYNSLANPVPPQPFLSENIVILQDGLCGSTCAIFSELMREQGKVQTIVVGGRPQNAPMQSIGGTKGSQVFGFDLIYHFVNRTLLTAQALDGDAVAKKINETIVGRLFAGTQLAQRSAQVPGKRIVGGVNALNNQRQGDASETPLEFIYDAADCRLFYTRDTFYKPELLWKQAAAAKWGSGKCVDGSTGNKAAIGVVNKQPFGSGNKSSSSSSSSTTSTPGQSGNAASGLHVPALLALLASVMAMMSSL